MARVWLITGAGSGIGESVAKAALESGDQVMVTGRNVEKLRAVFAGASPDHIRFARLDVTNDEEARAAAEQTVRHFARIDVLVNNAGYSILGNFESITASELTAQMATNFFGMANVMRASLPAMRAQRSGRIINVSSVAGVVGQKHCAAYAASKFAVEGLSLAVAEEVAQFGISVTIVEPGFFRTNLLDPKNVLWATHPVEDYAAEGSPEAMWGKYNGAQTNDPKKLAAALVKVAGMANPPQVFVAGSDALDMIRPALESRLRDMRRHEDLSRGMEVSTVPVE